MLTAAHCVYNNMNEMVANDDIDVYLGDHEIFDEDKFIMQLSNILVHPAYDRNT